MLREAIGFASQRAQFEHFVVDLLQARHAPFFKHGEKFCQHLRDRHGIVRRAVGVELRELQVVGNDVELVFSKPRQQILRQNERVDIGRLERNAAFLAAGTDKADIKFRVVCRKRRVTREGEERRQRVLELWRAAQHLVRDAGQSDDLRRQPALGVYEGLEGLNDLAVPEPHRADLRDGLLRDLEAGRFNVEADDLIGKTDVLMPMNGDAVVNVVDKIALAAVKYFYFTLTGVPGIRKGLRHTVVGDGDGGHPPLGGELDDAAGVGQRVHVGHSRMQVQLHALDLGSVHARLVRDLGHVARVELHIVTVVGQLHHARDAQPHTGRNAVAQRRDVLFQHPLAHDDRALVVGHLNERQPHTRLAQLTELALEDLALDHDVSRLGVQLAHRHGMSLDLAAHDDLAGA